MLAMSRRALVLAPLAAVWLVTQARADVDMLHCNPFATVDKGTPSSASRD